MLPMTLCIKLSYIHGAQIKILSLVSPPKTKFGVGTESNFCAAFFLARHGLRFVGLAPRSEGCWFSRGAPVGRNIGYGAFAFLPLNTGDEGMRQAYLRQNVCVRPLVARWLATEQHIPPIQSALNLKNVLLELLR